VYISLDSYNTYCNCEQCRRSVFFTDNLTRLTKLEVDETVKGVLSVPFPTYEVTGSMSVEGEEFSEVLLSGYEYPGIPAPD
jgi:hypothetical protein